MSLSGVEMPNTLSTVLLAFGVFAVSTVALSSTAPLAGPSAATALYSAPAIAGSRVAHSSSVRPNDHFVSRSAALRASRDEQVAEPVQYPTEDQVAEGYGQAQQTVPWLTATEGLMALVTSAVAAVAFALGRRSPPQQSAEPLLPVQQSPGALSRRQFQMSAVTLGLTAPAWGTALPALAEEVKVPSAQLGTLQVSRIIQGHWQLAGGHGRTPFDDPSANMRNHLNAGIYTFDTADIYGGSQEFIGDYLAKEKPEGAVVCTKFCCFSNLSRIDLNSTRKSILDSCKRLGVKQLDLVAFFWGDWNVKNYVQTGLYLKQLKEEGLIKEIGVTNFDTAHLKELVDAGVPVVSNQVQYSLIDRRPENGLLKYCDETGIKVIAFGCVGSGYISEKYLGQPRPVKIDNYSEGLYSASIAQAGGWKVHQQLLQCLDGIAKKHNVTIANVAEKWVLQKPEVAAIIIGVRNSNHIQENVNTFSFDLDAEDLAAISAVLEKQTPPAGDIWFRERGLI